MGPYAWTRCREEWFAFEDSNGASCATLCRRGLHPELACVGDVSDGHPSWDRPRCPQEVGQYHPTQASSVKLMEIAR